MHCPKCKNVDLRPTKLDESLPAMFCPKCEGSLISLLYYRDWVERVTLEAHDSGAAGSVAEESDTKTALSCPKCSRIMTKYSVSGTSRNRIDLCGGCDEAWLDGDEWTLLKSLELADKLPKVFTDQWQRRVRDEKTELNRIERLTKVAGQSDTERAIEVKKWLSNNPNRSAIIHFLGTQ